MHPLILSWQRVARDESRDYKTNFTGHYLSLLLLFNLGKTTYNFSTDINFEKLPD